MITLEKAKNIFELLENRTVINITVLKGGYAGDVFKISTDQGSQVLKLYEKEDTDVESTDDRVYGSNHANLQSAHALLKQNDISTFELLNYGEIEGYTFAIFSLLDGIEVNNEIVQSKTFAETLACIHGITRGYQGWVVNDKAYTLSWRDAFIESTYSRLHDVKNIITTKLYIQVKDFIDSKSSYFENPTKYVLSHLDGLQALFKLTENVWHLSGVIDVEDYQFTDQRFVLSGITLNEKLGRYSLPFSFWEIYQSVTPIESTFKEFETFFQTYYLLTWIEVLSNVTEEQNKCISLLSEITKNN